MKAILTHYLGPTNFRGSRIVATAEGGHRIVVPFDYGARDPHAVAAAALLERLGWKGEMVGGGLPNGDTAWVFVCGSDRIGIKEAPAFRRGALKGDR